MSLSNLTILYPPVSPLERITSSTITVSGGVYSTLLLASVLVTNVSHPNPTSLFATKTSLGGGEYEWSCSGVSLVEGNNTINIEAIDNEGGQISTQTMVYVDSVNPVVIASTPANNSTNVPVNTSLAVIFSEPMNVAVTLASLSVLPAVSGSWSAGGDEKTFYLQPIEYLTATTNYHISVNGAVDKMGNVCFPTTISFVSGLGIGAKDPTRRGLNPPQELLRVEAEVEGQQTLVERTSHGHQVNPLFVQGYLSGFYAMKKNRAVGSVYGLETGVASGSQVNPPQIIRPFRDKRNNGIVLDMETGFGRSLTVNPEVLNGFRSTQLAIRKNRAVGEVVDITDTRSFNYIPKILNYVFANRIGEGVVPKLASMRPMVEWNVPNDTGDARVHFRVEISKYLSFSRPFVFDSYFSATGFEIAEDGQNFAPMEETGARSGVGKVKFTCPVDLSSGVWFIRIMVGNEQ